MNSRIDDVTSELLAAGDDARRSFGSFSNEQLNWKPSEKGWSVAQCLDHLIKSNVEFDGDWEKLLNGTRKNSFRENWSPLTGFWGRFLIKTLANDAKKTKAPSKSIVPPSEIEPGIVERFVKNIETKNRNIAGCEGIDLKKTVLTSPFLGIVTYNLDDAFSILVEHTKRHIRQAKRVTEAEGFPR
ncbi:MAG TPA: DinB family protein [Pyrinomonadaceae bacterium]|nr:DinB family protein [Pyrinomonadaceae bacterium]